MESCYAIISNDNQNKKASAIGTSNLLRKNSNATELELGKETLYLLSGTIIKIYIGNRLKSCDNIELDFFNTTIVIPKETIFIIGDYYKNVKINGNVEVLENSKYISISDLNIVKKTQTMQDFTLHKSTIIELAKGATLSAFHKNDIIKFNLRENYKFYFGN